MSMKTFEKRIEALEQAAGTDWRTYKFKSIGKPVALTTFGPFVPSPQTPPVQAVRVLLGQPTPGLSDAENRALVLISEAQLPMGTWPMFEPSEAERLRRAIQAMRHVDKLLAQGREGDARAYIDELYRRSDAEHKRWQAYGWRLENKRWTKKEKSAVDLHRESGGERWAESAADLERSYGPDPVESPDHFGGADPDFEAPLTYRV